MIGCSIRWWQMNNILERYIGAPWADNGTDDNGFDCWGLLVHVYRTFYDINIPETYTYNLENKIRTTKLIEEVTQTPSWQEIATPVEGCAVGLSQNKHIHHVGVWIDDACLHANRRFGVVYQNLRQLNMSGYSLIKFYQYQGGKV